MSNDALLSALEGLSRSLNILGRERDNKQAVTLWFERTHRTLQQQFVKVVIIPILEKLADDYQNGRCDGRNMSSGRLATLMLKDLTDDDLYLPLI